MANIKRRSFVTLTVQTRTKTTTTAIISSSITNKRKSRKAITNRTSLGNIQHINNQNAIKYRRNEEMDLGKFVEFGIIILIMMTSMRGNGVAAIAKMDYYVERQMLPVLNQIKTEQNLESTTSKFIPSLEATTTRQQQQSASTLTTSTIHNNYINYDDNDFHPIIPKDIPLESITANVFTKNGQYRVFQPDDSDLRAAAAKENRLRWRWRLHNENKQKSQERGETKGDEKKEMEQPQKAQAVTNNWSKLKEENKKRQTLTKERIVSAKTSSKQPRATTSVKTATAVVITTTPITKTTSPEILTTPATTMTPETKTVNEIANGTSPTSPLSSSSTGAFQNQDIPLGRDEKDLEDLLSEYIGNFFIKGQYEPLPELIAELKKNHSESSQAQEIAGNTNHNSSSTHDDSNDDDNDEDLAGLVDENIRDTREIETVPSLSRTLSSLLSALKEGKDNDEHISRDLQTGRLIFITGLKKIIWPIFMGLQILKSLLFAMFLPTLIGSFGKIVSKGISSASIRPMEAPQDLDFRDHTFNFDEENNKFIINDDVGDKNEAAYQQQLAEATQMHYTNSNGVNYDVLSRFGGINEKQLNRMPDSYMNALQSIGAASFKNSGSLSGSSSQAFSQPNFHRKPVPAANTNNFQTFHKVPATSLLLSNYDPFYSPLLSRLDSVFAQLKLNSENEICREKLICLMYANPAKYAPYSNLVSAQLSRELNELRKPTSDNPDILRFFKYMRAAKDGQDGIDCETTFDGCKEFKDYENPAMLSTYHDINKLVQARKLN